MPGNKFASFNEFLIIFTFIKFIQISFFKWFLDFLFFFIFIRTLLRRRRWWYWWWRWRWWRWQWNVFIFTKCYFFHFDDLFILYDIRFFCTKLIFQLFNFLLLVLDNEFHSLDALMRFFKGFQRDQHVTLFTFNSCKLTFHLNVEIKIIQYYSFSTVEGA